MNSSFTIEEISNPNAIDLKAVPFQCDKIIRNVPKPFPCVTSYIVITGPSRSGKTNLLVNMLTNRRLYYKAFENVILCMPRHSITSLKKNIFEGLSDEKVYNELTFENLNNIYDQIQEYADEDENTLLILDDVTSSLKDHSLLKLLNLLVNNRRHLKVTIIMLTQYFNSIPLSNRRTITHLIMFKSKNNTEIENIRSEMTPYSKDEFSAILKYVFNKPFEYLVFDRDNDKIYKKFNELILRR